MTIEDIISDSLSLISAASEDWLINKQYKFKTDLIKANNLKTKKERLEKYKKIKSKFDRIHEIDAQLELLKMNEDDYPEVVQQSIESLERLKKIILSNR